MKVFNGPVLYTNYKRLNLDARILEREAETVSHKGEGAWYTLGIKVLDNKQMKTLDKKKADAENNIKDYQAKLTETTGQLEAKQKEKDAADENVNKQQAVVDKITADLAGFDEKTEKEFNEIGEKLQNELGERSVKVSALDSVVAEKEKAVAELQAKLKELNNVGFFARKDKAAIASTTEELTQQTELLNVNREFLAEAQKKLLDLNDRIKKAADTKANQEAEKEKLMQRQMEESQKLAELQGKQFMLDKDLGELKTSKTDYERAIEKQQTDIKSFDASKNMMKNLFKQDSDKIKAFQDFVAQIETTLMRYGVSGDGELLSDEVMEAMKSSKTFKSNEDVAKFNNKVQDLAHEVNKAREKDAK
jgi:chromosome segregation ATPase